MPRQKTSKNAVSRKENDEYLRRKYGYVDLIDDVVQSLFIADADNNGLDTLLGKEMFQVSLILSGMLIDQQKLQEFREKHEMPDLLPARDIRSLLMEYGESIGFYPRDRSVTLNEEDFEGTSEIDMNLMNDELQPLGLMSLQELDKSLGQMVIENLRDIAFMKSLKNRKIK